MAIALPVKLRETNAPGSLVILVVDPSPGLFQAIPLSLYFSFALSTLFSLITVLRVISANF